MSNVTHLHARRTISRSRADADTRPADRRAFRVPTAISEDLAFALEASDGEVLAAAIRRQKIAFETFASTDVAAADMPDNLPALRVAHVALPNGPELLLVLPAVAFTETDAVELLLRILASGRAYVDGSALMVLRPDGSDLLMIGGWDRSGEAPDCFILGFDADNDIPKPNAPASTAIH